MTKKILSVVLCIVMVLSIFTIIPFEFSAQETEIAQLGTSKTADEAINWVKSKVGTSVGYNDGSGQYQCVELVQEYYRQLGVSAVSGNGCDYAWNSLPSGWTRTAGGTPKKGDILVYTDGGYGHVAIYESDYSFYQQNYNYHPYVEHSTFKYNNYSMMHVTYWGCIHPNFSSGVNYADLGTSFYAYIKNPNSGKYVTAESSGNVDIRTDSGESQRWYFEKLGSSSSDNAYRITNMENGNCLDVDGGSAKNNVNVKTYTSNGTNAQRWYFIKSGTGYKLVPKCGTSFALDVEGVGVDNGTNIQIYTQQTTPAQIFELVEAPNFVPVNLGEDFCANIINAPCGKLLSVNTDVADHVQLYTRGTNNNQEWQFIKQPDNTYKIKNIGNGKYLLVNTSSKDNGTIIKTWSDENIESQRFFIRYNNVGFGIVPKINVKSALDLTNGSTDDGTQVQEYTWNASNAQTFSIDYTSLTPTKTISYNGHKYEYYDQAMTWNQAYRVCEKKGGHLVTVSSEEENNLIYELASQYNKDYCWLGLTHFGGKWDWIDSTKLEYTNWASSEPNNSGGEENYAQYRVSSSAKTWNDVSITSSYQMRCGFICEYDKSTVNADNYTPTKAFSYLDKEYEIYDIGVDWQTAEEICEKKGGHLVVIDEEIENAILSVYLSYTNKSEYWMGITDNENEGIWKTFDGKSLTYTNWRDGDPSNDFNAEQYAVFCKEDNKWIDLKGFSFQYRSVGFICEYEPKPSCIIGDADGDKNVTIIDATLVQKWLARLVTDNEIDLNAADTDHDKYVTISDATKIQKFLANIIKEL